MAVVPDDQLLKEERAYDAGQIYRIQIATDLTLFLSLAHLFGQQVTESVTGIDVSVTHNRCE
jgi:hypothetical protein